jgi:hypothetical protein
VAWTEASGAETLLVSRRVYGGYRLEQAPYASVEEGGACFVPALDGAPEAWDAEMTCFGAPLRIGGRDLLFYNGNRFGRSGFGLAWRPAAGSD